MFKEVNISAIPKVKSNKNIDKRAVKAAGEFVKQSKLLIDKSYWAVKMFTSMNVFLWHLDAFAEKEDPVPMFVDIMHKAAKALEAIRTSGVCGSHFPIEARDSVNDKLFEENVYGLFSDIWLGMTDDIYFDQSFEFTKERFLKNKIDPYQFFKDKIVLDAGCGSGKFSTAIARFGAKKVIGLDIGEKGLEFARKQAAKTDFESILEYRSGSLLDMPFEDDYADIVWSNGVVHHTLNYEKCIQEFSRVIKPGGSLFLYVNGRFGLFELLVDSLKQATSDVPRQHFQYFLTGLNINSGRIYWMLDCIYAPYEWKSRAEVIGLLKKYGFANMYQFLRGVETDQIEQVTMDIPYAEVKYGEAQLKFIAEKV